MKPFQVDHHDIRRSLATSDLFQGLDDPTLDSLESELELVHLAAGEVLMRQGEIGDCLFVLISGRLRAFINRDAGAEVPVGEISPGEVVGEMAILTEEPRSATVRAVRPSALVRLTRTSFQRLIDAHTQIVRQLARVLIYRLKRINAPRARRKAPLTIGFIAGSSHIALSDVVRQFADALSQIDTACLLNASIVDSQVGPRSSEIPIDSDASLGVTNWISENEKAHRFIVYEAGAAAGEWTRRVVQHSDRLFIVVSGSPSADEDYPAFLAKSGVARSVARKDLLVVHPSSNVLPASVSRWQEIFALDDHYHARLPVARDFGRLARIVAGDAVGLVLGGGGARSFAHIGVIRALNEAGIPIDFIGGTSVGAFIAAQYSMDWTPQQMLEANREVFRLHPLHGDHASPLVSVGTPEKSVRLFQRLFAENRIEDQLRSFFCVSCSLTRGEAVIHRSGRFHDCVEASSALPILSTPVFEKDDLLVDGALVNNLPADVMQSICGGRVIAVDVSSRHDLRALVEAKNEGAVGAAARIVRPGSKSAIMPSNYNVAMRTVMLNSVMSSDSMKRYIDLYLKPPVDQIEMFDWMSIQETAEIGYRYTMAELESRPAGIW